MCSTTSSFRPRAWECVPQLSHSLQSLSSLLTRCCRSPCCCCCCCLRTRAIQTFSVDDTIVLILREQPGGIAPPSSDERAQSPDRAELLLNVCHSAPTPPPFTCFVHLHRIPLHCAQRAGHTSLGHIHYASFDKHTTWGPLPMAHVPCPHPPTYPHPPPTHPHTHTKRATRADDVLCTSSCRTLSCGGAADAVLEQGSERCSCADRRAGARLSLALLLGRCCGRAGGRPEDIDCSAQPRVGKAPGAVHTH